MVLRYLDADRVELPASAPQFTEEGRCQWCNRPLTGKARKFCSLKDLRQRDPQYRWYEDSPCAIHFSNYFYQRPAYQRAVFIRDNFTCRKCQRKPRVKGRPWLPDMSWLHCDHIIPISRGGETEVSNLQTLCKQCHKKKTRRDSREGRVLASRDGSRCPICNRRGYIEISWDVPQHLDPEMKKVRCSSCQTVSFLSPRPRKRQRVLATV